MLLPYQPAYLRYEHTVSIMAASLLCLPAGAVKAALQMPSKQQGIVNCW